MRIAGRFPKQPRERPSRRQRRSSLRLLLAAVGLALLSAAGAGILLTEPVAAQSEDTTSATIDSAETAQEVDPAQPENDSNNGTRSPKEAIAIVVGLFVIAATYLIVQIRNRKPSEPE